MTAHDESAYVKSLPGDDKCSDCDCETVAECLTPTGSEELCARCGHRYAVHAGLPESRCVRAVGNGHTCQCPEFERNAR